MEPLAQELTQVVQHHSFWDLFWQAGWVVKGVIVFLLGASLWSWTLVISKLWMFFQCKRNLRFWEQRVSESHSWDQFSQTILSYRDGIGGAIGKGILQEYQQILRSEESLSKEQLQNRLTRRSQIFVRQLVQVAENRLGFVASVGSSAPFIGLFGTVWGIMDSFQSIGVSQNTSLAVVAPGIAEALFATAIGLFVAIPAFIAYNRFVSEVAGLEDRLEFLAYRLVERAVSSFSPRKSDSEERFGGGYRNIRDIMS